MPPADHTEEELHRARLLERLVLLNDDADPAFDRLTAVAAAVTGAPVALLTFLGPDRQWVPSRVGWEAGWTPLTEAFCRFAVGSAELLEVPDACADTRFSSNPLVTGAHSIRFYAGHPVMFDGMVLGTVCVLDRQTRMLDSAQKSVLSSLAAMASDLLAQRDDRRVRIEREAQAASLRAALERSESMLAAAQRVAGLGSWELHPADGPIFSAETLRLLQAPAAPLAFTDFLGHFRLDDGTPFEPVLDEPVSCELQVVDPGGVGGGERWVRWVSQPVTRAEDDGAGVRTVVGTLLDISGVKAGERRLRAVEDRFQLLWKTTPDVVVMVDAHDRIRFINPAVRELLGHEPEALLGQDLAILQPERMRKAHRHGFRRYLDTGVRRLDWRATEAVGLHRDGHEIPIEVSFSDMELDGERMFGACIRDLSVRKRQELALQQSEASYRRIVETAAEGIWLVDEAGATRFVNPFMAALLGHSADAMTGHPLTHYLAETDPAQRAVEQQRLQLADAPPRELLLRHAEGGTVWARVVSNPIVEPDGRYVGALAMVTDITDRKKADAAQRTLAKQLREAQKMEAIGALAGGVAHDFNNVLAGILGNVALALDEIDGGHPAWPYLRQINKGSRRGRELVGQILSFARRQPQVLRDCELNALVEESAGLLRSTLPAGVRLSLTLTPQALGIHADPTQIGQVVTNLCTNAVQSLAGEAGTVILGTGRSWLDGDDAVRAQLDPGEYVHLWVRDTGHGMNETTLARIFEPFFSTKAVGEGTGLGLSVVHGIVSAHGGSVTVDSTPGVGSCFHVYLRPGAAPADPESRSGALAPGAEAHGHGERILYVDDDDVMLTMVECLLQRLGYRAVVMASADEALAALRAAPWQFAAVVTDFNMPGLSGLQLAEQIGTLRGDLPVLVSSGNVTEELLRGAVRQGVCGVLRKQFLVEELGDALAKALHAGTASD